MPIGSYYRGHGREVMNKMKDEYGPKKGESVFYATANARKQTPTKKVRKPPATGSANRKLLVRPAGGSRVPSNIRKHNRQMQRLYQREHPPTPYVSGHQRYNA